MEKLPINLESSPLQVARFEMRLNTDDPFIEGLVIQFMSNNLSKDSKLKVDRLPISDIPKQVRDNDQNLKYAPLKRMYHPNDSYSIFVGDKLLSISCDDYQSWNSFKKYIVDLVIFLENTPFSMQGIDLVKTTYIDFIEKSTYSELSDVLDWTIQFKQYDFSNNEDVFIKTSIKKPIVPDEYRCYVQIVTNAKLEKTSALGIAIETSAEHKIDDDFSRNYIEIFDKLHDFNKKTFFMCLTNDFLNKLGPKYE